MAISRFQQASGSTDLSAFYQWLNANKAGTFLEGLTITNTQTNRTNDTIIISETNIDVKIISLTGADSIVFKYAAGLMEKSIKTPNESGTNAYIVGALLCNKGLLLQYYGGYGIEGVNNNWGACITVDNDGQLAAIMTADNIPSSTTELTSWDTFILGSTSNARRLCRPSYGASLTSLAQISAQGLDNTSALPYAYAAISTQVDSEGLNSILIDGAPFITNGLWYIKDADD